MLAPETLLRDRYRILHKVGGGGFGYVYKAVDEVFGCSVAVKETKEQVSSLDQLRKAFEREAKLLRNLKHECLPRVTDYFFHDQAQFLVMDFIEGEDLAARLRRRVGREGPFTAREILPWADKILSALEYLHTRSDPIIHRDIKPSNIKLTEDGEIYLLDFGLAKGAAGQMSTVRDGESSFSLAAFTHEYASLEQLQDSGTQPQSDIYGLGATIYHLLTAQLPISAAMRDEATQRGHGDPLKPAHEVNTAIPLAISQIISQAMTIRWWDRLGSAKEMRSALARATGEIGSAQPLTEADAQPVSPLPHVAKDSVPTLQFQQPHGSVLPKNESAQTTPTQTVLTPHGLRRAWLIAGLSLVIVAAVAIGMRLVFPQWFAPAVLTKAISQPPSSENPKSASLMTAGNLHVKPPLMGHKKTVWSIAFSRDGSLAASGSEDRTIILWDTNTWKPKFPPLTGHDSPVYSVAFSPDGKTLASASKDRMIMLWDTQAGKFVKALQEGTKPVFSVAFSPVDSPAEVLASISGEPEKGGEEIRLWYKSTGWQSKTLPFNSSENKIYAIAFSPDGNTLAAAGYGKAIRMWNLKNRERSRDMYIDQPSAGAFVSRLAFSADGKYLAAASNDGSIKLWETEKWEEMERLGKEQSKVITAIAFSPDNTTLVSASSDNTIRLWNIATGTSTLLAASSDKISQSLAFSPDGQTLLSGGTDQMISVWQLQTAR